MANLAKIAQSGKASQGAPHPVNNLKSGYDGGLKKQYFAQQTRDYVQEYGEYASNVYDAQSQGLLTSSFYDWRPIRIRVAPLSQGSTGEIMPDDWQRVHVIKPAGIDYVPIGAYLTFADNTWIVYKGANMGSVLGDGILRRCNAVIHTLDWYGNIVEVPMSFAKMGTLGNASHATENSIVAKNYMACVCQKNAASENFTENTRIILGKTAYSMRGVNDFTREFTDDEDSVHLMTFTIERSEVLEQDSLEYQCADYNSFDWRMNVFAPDSMNVGTASTIGVESRRMGVLAESSTEYPISYIFESSDTGVAVVDADGDITAMGEGTATITVTLAQNPDITEPVDITVTDAGERFIAFTSTPVSSLKEYESVVISAAVFENGRETTEDVSFGFSGPANGVYGVTRTAGENQITLTAYGPSQIPLTVTAETDDLSTSMEIRLLSR